MSARAVTKDQERDIARQYGEGSSLSSLASAYGCSTKAIGAALDRQKVKRKERVALDFIEPCFSSEYISDLVARWEAGETPREIATSLRISRAAMLRILRDAVYQKHAGATTEKRSRRQSLKGSDVPFPKRTWNHWGETTDGSGYVRVTIAPDDPCFPMSYGGRIPLHRLVMSRAKRRLLRSDESVHHIDGNPSNNDISNLQLRSTPQHGKGSVWMCGDCGSLDMGYRGLG